MFPFSINFVEKISELVEDFAFNYIAPTTSIIQNIFSEHVLLHLISYTWSKGGNWQPA